MELSSFIETPKLGNITIYERYWVISYLYNIVNTVNLKYIVLDCIPLVSI